MRYHELIDHEEKAAIQYLHNNTQKYGYYWLYGQLKLTPSEAITYEKIEEAIAFNTKRLQDYGAPCNAMEMYSIADHEKRFSLLRTTIEKYYQYQYAPPNETYPCGGAFYQYLAKITNIGK
jgi:hypothetical protein